MTPLRLLGGVGLSCSGSMALMFQDGLTYPTCLTTWFPQSRFSATQLVWWVGFALMLVLTERAIHGRQLVANLRSRISNSSARKQISIRAQGWDIPAIFIAVVFFFTWLPYIFIGRATYIYHFYLSVPLLCLAITYFINKYWNTREGKIAAIAIFAGTVALFALFYPVISGAPVSTSYIHTYLKWFPSWGDFA